MNADNFIVKWIIACWLMLGVCFLIDNCKVCMCYKMSAYSTILMMLCFSESLALGC